MAPDTTRFSTTTLSPAPQCGVAAACSWPENCKDFFLWTGPDFECAGAPNALLEIIAAADGKISNMVLVDRFTGEFVAYGEVHVIDAVSGWCRLARLIVNPNGFRRKGIGGKLLSLLERKAVDEFSCHRLDLLVFADNSVAIQLYKRADFVVEGVMNRARFFKRNFYSPVIMAKLMQR